MSRLPNASAPFLLLLIPLLLGPTSEPADKTFDAKTGTQWFPYLEWRIENPSYEGNPFDVEAKAVFVHHSTGETVTTRLFYDGNGLWRFRFTGTHTGDWTFQTVSDDADLHRWTGTASITENPDPDAHGFIKAFGSKWGWQGTEEAFIPQYVMAKEPRAYLGAGGTVDTAKIEADVRTFVGDHGFTGFHLNVGGAWFEGEDPDPRVYRALEEAIRRVHRRGGACHLWLWGSGSRGERGEGPVALAGGPMSEPDRRNLRYLAARLGPIPGWSMGYGYDTENGWASVEELDVWKAFLEGEMAYDHFLGARVGYDEKGLFAVEPRPPRPPHDAGFRSPIADRYTTWLGGDYTGYTSYRPPLPALRAGPLPSPGEAVVRGGPLPPARLGAVELQGLQRRTHAAGAVARGHGGRRSQYLGQPFARSGSGRLAALCYQRADQDLRPLFQTALP